MKKILSLFLVSILAFSPTIYAADQWDKTDPAGTENMSDIDTLIQANNEALDRLVINFRRNLAVIPDTSNQVSVLTGEIAIPNASGSVVRWRRTTSTTTVTWADIDTGSESTATQYYVYATADTDVTGIVFKISTSASAPSGSTYYRKIGYFYNNASGNIVHVGNIKDSDAPNALKVVGTSDVSTSSTSYTDLDDMEIKMVTNGRPVKIDFVAPTYNTTQGAVNYFAIVVDGSERLNTANQMEQTSGYLEFISATYLDTALSAGTHTIKVQWKVSSGTGTQGGTSEGERIITAVEE